MRSKCVTVALIIVVAVGVMAGCGGDGGMVSGTPPHEDRGPCANCHSQLIGRDVLPNEFGPVVPMAALA